VDDVGRVKVFKGTEQLVDKELDVVDLQLLL
jgi:hypothetical protein